MAYSLRKRIRKGKISKRKENKKTRRFKKSRKQYGGRSPSATPFGVDNIFIAQITSILNEFDFFSEREKDELMDKLQRSAQWYIQNPNRLHTLINQLNVAKNSTTSTPDEKKVFITKLFDFWLNPHGYRNES